MQETPRIHPSPAACLIFSVTLGALSNVFAEVIGGSCPLALLSPAGLLLTYPTYAFQILTLGAFALRRGQHSLRTLYFAGTVFGLYEAYITKILWDPTWNHHAFRIGGVAVIETLLLVLFWHPIMAFVIPALVAERWLAGAPHLRAFLESARAPYIIGAILGLNNGLMSKPAFVALPSVLGSVAIVVILVALWRKNHVPAPFDVGDLLPRGRAQVVLVAMVLFEYGLFGWKWRPESLPGINGQATIWLLYAILGGLMFVSIRQTWVRIDAPQRYLEETPLLPTALKRGLATFAVCSLAVCWMPQPVPTIAFLVLWAVCTPLGCVVFYKAVKSLRNA